MGHILKEAEAQLFIHSTSFRRDVINAQTEWLFRPWLSLRMPRLNLAGG